MSDIVIFICGALTSIILFIIGAVFGAAIHTYAADNIADKVDRVLYTYCDDCGAIEQEADAS